MKGTIKTAFAAALLALVFAGCTSCGSKPYAGVVTGHRVLDFSVQLVEQTDAAFGSWAAGVKAECTAKGLQAGTPAYSECIKPAVELLRAWHGMENGKPTGKGVLPAVQSAQRATRLALDAAYDYIKSHEAECSKEGAPKACSGNWQVLIKPGVCVLVEIIDRGVKLGAYKATDSPVYKAVKMFADGVCK